MLTRANSTRIASGSIPNNFERRQTVFPAAARCSRGIGRCLILKVPRVAVRGGGLEEIEASRPGGGTWDERLAIARCLCQPSLFNTGSLEPPLRLTLWVHGSFNHSCQNYLMKAWSQTRFTDFKIHSYVKQILNRVGVMNLN